MKHLLLLFSLIFGLLNQSSNVDLTPKMLKSIDKEISKSWKGINVLRSPLLINNENNGISELKSGETFVLSKDMDTLAYLFVRRTNGCTIGGCTINSVGEINLPGSNNFAERYEHFDYMIILNKDLSVKKVKVLVYDGEYGYEISSKLWLKQFIGYQGDKLDYGSDIQAISGATVSAQSITHDIQLVVKSAIELRKLGVI